MNVPVVRASADLRLLRAAVFTAACVALSAGAHTLGGGATSDAVPLWTWGLAAVLTFALVAPLAGRERTLPGIAASLALGQVALHGLYTWGQSLSVGRSGDDGQSVVELARGLLCNDQLAAGMTVRHARRLLDDAGLGHLATGAGAPGAHGAHDVAGGAGAAAGGVELSVGDATWLALRGVIGSMTSPMLLAHLAAAVATGVLLRRGEAALWRLVRLSAVAVDELLLRALRDVLHWVRALGAVREKALRPVRVAAGTRLFVPTEATTLRHSVTRRGPPWDADDFALTA